MRGEVLADGDKRFPLIAHQVGLGFDLLLETLRTPEGAPLLGNTLAELRRAMAGMQLTAGQIRDIDSAEQLQQLNPRTHPMVRTPAQVCGMRAA